MLEALGCERVDHLSTLYDEFIDRISLYECNSEVTQVFSVFVEFSRCVSHGNTSQN